MAEYHQRSGSGRVWWNTVDREEHYELQSYKAPALSSFRSIWDDKVKLHRVVDFKNRFEPVEVGGSNILGEAYDLFKRKVQERKNARRPHRIIRPTTVAPRQLQRALRYWREVDDNSKGVKVVHESDGVHVRGNGGIRTYLPDYIEYEIRNNLEGEMNGIKIHVIGQKYDEMKVTSGNAPGTEGHYSFVAKYFKRCIMVTQTIGADEIVFFGMYVTEFEKDCGIKRNEGRVYLSYLDSTPHYVRGPNDGNVRIKRLVINAYMHFVAALGFHSVHIWSCPPSQTSPFWVFNCGQRPILSREQLFKWYEKVIQDGEWPKYELHGSMKLTDDNIFEVPLFPGDVKTLALKKYDKKENTTFWVANIIRVNVSTSKWFGRFNERTTCYWSPFVPRPKIRRLMFDNISLASVSTKVLLASTLVETPEFATNSQRIKHPKKYANGKGNRRKAFEILKSKASGMFNLDNVKFEDLGV